MRRMIWLAPLIAGLHLAGCGSDGIGNDPGEGSGTLLVNARVEYDNEDGTADFRVHVRKGGVDVTNAIVTIESDLGTVTLPHNGGDEYRGVQAGWADGYQLDVAAGPDDHLSGSIDAPGAIEVTSPDPQIPFDPHLAENGIVAVDWDGERAMTAHVRTKDFEWGPFPDEGETLIPANYFQEDQQDINIDRENSLGLAGGAPGSDFAAQFDVRIRVTLLNPF